MQFARAFGIVVVLFATTALSGCSSLYYADFPVSVGNRTANTIRVYANGREVGDVGAGRTAPFSVSLRTINTGILAGYTTTPTAQAQVAFAARDLTTGLLSTGKNPTVFQDHPINVEFTAADFVR